MDDLNAFAMKLLMFAVTSVEEGLADPSSRNGLLAEADGAIATLKGTLRRESPTKLTQLMLIGTFDSDLGSLADADAYTLSEKLKELSRTVEIAREIFRS